MSGIGGSEFLLLCLIGLLILGPERLPRVASQLGSWVGKARRMTRQMRRQLEDELSAEKNLGFDPNEIKKQFDPNEIKKQFDPNQIITPRDDDTYSPLHDEEEPVTPPPPAEDKGEKPA
jgi:sec-independent protein translocase protein TatB